MANTDQLHLDYLSVQTSTYTMGPFKLSSNQLISELGISLQIAYVEHTNAILQIHGC